MKNFFGCTTYSHFCSLYWLGIVVICFGCGQKEVPESEADLALNTFQLAPGFRIELIAAEPLIGDPVDMEIDEYGRLYVVEMPGYPLDKSGSGMIKILSDTNGDGRMDKSKVFAEGLVLPNSIMRWKNGVIVTDAPNVLYFEDGDGDGKAEIRDTLLTGFALSNPQHNLNSPVLGIDNWIYLAHEGAVSTDTYKEAFGDRGQDVYFPGRANSPRLGRNADGRGVRFQPDRDLLEVTSGHSQFGHTFDAWGHHLLVGNANHIFQEVIAENYLRRNPDLPIADATQSLSDHGNAAEVFPVTLNPEHQLLTDVGVITSACGLTAYLGGAFPPPFDGNITFVAEPVSNLIHADRLSDKETSFTASRVFEHKEFLASTDPKFRPVNMYIGPDGALYVVDYYRQIIEHPEWMGEEVVKSGALYNDNDKGRIYRITAAGATTAGWTQGLNLGDADNTELVEQLANANIWWRQNAQRLLIDRNDKQAAPALTQMAINKNAPSGRLHALWTLEGMGALRSEHIWLALMDSVAGIRENAIKLAELHLTEDPDLVKSLLPLQEDPDAKVRFQLLCTLGSVATPEAEQARHQLLFRDIDNEWVQVAALSVKSSQTSLLKLVLDNFKDESPAYASMVQRLTTMAGGVEEPRAIHTLIQMATDTNQHAWQGSVLDGLAEGMKNRAPRVFIAEADEQLLINTFFQHRAAAVRNASLRLLKVNGIKKEALAIAAIEKAVLLAGDPDESPDKRAEAISFISLRDPSAYDSLMKKLFVPQEPLTIQLAALRTLAASRDTTVSQFLLDQWSTLTPEIQDAVVSQFLNSKFRIAMLLNAIEAGTIGETSITWPRKVRLMAQSDEVLRDKARALFTKNNDAEVNKSYQQALALKGDEVKGKEIYQKNCALCHQVRGAMGVSLGPDLGTVHNWSKEAILANTLAPNKSISSGYDLWAVELSNGETLQGIIASETPGAITFKNTGSVEKTISRKDIKSLKAQNMSVMTVGLEKQITHQEMADLLAFLKQNK